MNIFSFTIECLLIVAGITYNTLTHYENWQPYLWTSLFVTGATMGSIETAFTYLSNSADFLLSRSSGLVQALIVAFELEGIALLFNKMYESTKSQADIFAQLDKYRLRSFSELYQEELERQDFLNEIISTTFTPPFGNALTFTLVCWAIATFIPLLFRQGLPSFR